MIISYFLFLVLLSAISVISLIHEEGRVSRFLWDEVLQNTIPENNGMISNGNDNHDAATNNPRIISASSLLSDKAPVYVSLATMKLRLDENRVWDTIRSVCQGTVSPTGIYLFISKEPYLLDEGISLDDLKLHESTLNDIRTEYPFIPITVVYTNNIGPHRKLLPILEHIGKIEEDNNCVIVTCDDDRVYPEEWLQTLVTYHEISQHKAIVSARARRIGICSGATSRIAPYTREDDEAGDNKLVELGLSLGFEKIGAFIGHSKGSHEQWPIAPSNLLEMLLLPTGVAGILYRPSLLNMDVIFSAQLINATVTNDDLLFRLASLANSVPILTACVPGLNGGLQQKLESSILKGWTTKNDYQSRQVNSDVTQPQPQGGHSRGLRHTQGARSVHEKRRNYRSVNDQMDSFRDRLRGYMCPVIDEALLVEINAMLHKIRQIKMAQNSNSKASSNSKSKLDSYFQPSRHLSLYRSYNSHGANNIMWDQAISILDRDGFFDLNEILQAYTINERQHCAISSSIFTDNEDGSSSLLSNLARPIFTSIQNTMSNLGFSCGVVSCPVQKWQSNEQRRIVMEQKESKKSKSFNEKLWDFFWWISGYIVIGPHPIHQ